MANGDQTYNTQVNQFNKTFKYYFMAILMTIQAKKVKVTNGIYKGYFQTEFYKNGTLFAIVPPESRQPKKGQRTYTLNCWKWALEWE